MYIYCIDCRIKREGYWEEFITTIIASSIEDCLYTLACYLSNYNMSFYCDDSFAWSKDEHLFLDAINNAQVFALADKEQVSKVIYYEGP